jgi:tetratricopeptide (TPR) repeat protein
MTYQDFDLLVERSRRGFRAQVLNSPAGRASVDFRLPFSPVKLENFLLRLGRTQRAVRRVESPAMQAAKTFGASLFQAVFAGDVKSCFWSSQEEAKRQGAGLRVRLRLGDAELADLPWEFLYNPAVNRFIALSVHTPLVRYMDLPERIQPIAVTPPIRVLVMISTPSDYPPLDAEREWGKLNVAVSDLLDSGQLAIDRLDDATLSALQRRLRRADYHIFHFIGHGEFDQDAQEGVLILESENERGHRVSSQYLGMLLHDHGSLRVSILNACEGARCSRTDPFAGSAQSLVQQGIPAVIAMQFEISEEVAATFAHEFYGALADGYPIDAALTESRKAIFASGREVEWGTPVLYLRAPDGRIFDIERATGDERSRRELTRLREECEAALQSRDWRTAIDRLHALLLIEPSDAQARAWLSDAEAGQEQLARESTALLDAAERDLAAGGLEAALDAAGRASALDPGSARARELLGRARTALNERRGRELVERAREQLHSGDLAAAAASIDAALSLSPRAREALELRRALEAERRRLDEAAARAAAIRSLVDRAEEQLRNGGFEAALAHAEEACRLDPGGAATTALETRVREAQQTAREEADRARASELLAAARAAADARDFAIALELTHQARALDPGHDLGAFVATLERTQAAAERSARAAEHLGAGSLDEAADAVREALALDADDAQALALAERIQSAIHEKAERERLEAKRQRLEAEREAREAAERARAEAERQAREAREREARRRQRLAAARNAFRVAFESSRLPEARAALTELEGLEPDAEWLPTLRAGVEGLAARLSTIERHWREAEAQVRGQDLSAALESLDRVLQLDAAHARALDLRARIERMDEERRARDAWVEAQAASAKAATDEGRHDDAVAMLSRALEIEPHAAALAALLVDAQRRRDEAAAERRRTERIESQLAAASRCAERGQLDAALRHVRAVLFLDPSVEAALRLQARIEEDLERERLHREEQRRKEERERQILALIGDAERAPTDETALEILHRARELDPSRTDVPGLIERRERRLAETRRREEHDRRARELVEAARRDFAAGDHDAALTALERFEPPHRLVSDTLANLRVKADAMARRARETAEARAAQLALVQEHLTHERFREALSVLQSAGAGLRQDPEVEPLRSAAEAGLRRVEAEEERRQSIERGLQAAASELEHGRYAEAAMALDGVRSLAPDDLRVADVGAAIDHGVERARVAGDAVLSATHLAAAGDLAAAVAELERFQPSHRVVDAALGELRARLARAERRRRLRDMLARWVATGSRLARDRRAVATLALLGSAAVVWVLWPQPRPVSLGPIPAVHRVWPPQLAPAGEVTRSQVGELGIPPLSDGPVESPGPETGTAGTTARLDALLDKGLHEEALAEARRVLRGAPGHAGATAVVGSLRASAEKNAVAARRRAEQAGAEQGWSANLRQGLESERRATRPGIAADAAVPEWWDARRFYERAARDAAEASRAAEQVAAHHKAGRRSEAIATVETGLRTYPQFAPFQQLLRTLYDDARSRAKSAGDRARTERRAGTQSFRNAAGEEQQAERLGVTPQAVVGFYRAADLYAAALREAAAPPAAAEVEPAVRAVLARIERAYESLDARQVIEVLPYLRLRQGADIERDFQNYRALRMDVVLQSLSISNDGRQVEARCQITQEFDKKAGRDTRQTFRRTYVLVNDGSGWVVDRER